MKSLVIPIGSVWSDDPFGADRDFCQTVVSSANDINVTYCSGSGDRLTVPRAQFLSMFPFRYREYEGLPGQEGLTALGDSAPDQEEGRPKT